MKRALSLLLLTVASAFGQMDDVAFISSLSETNIPPSAWDPTTNNASLARYDINALALNDGDTVSSVTDSAGLGYDLLSSGAAMPYWTNNPSLLNGLGYLVFDGTSDYVRAVFASYAQPTTFFLVARCYSDGATTAVWCDNGDNTTFQVLLHSNFAVAANCGLYLENAPQITTWQVWEICFNGASSFIKYNAGTTKLSGNLGANARKGITIGQGRNNADALYKRMDVAFATFYTNTLDATTTSNINYYLKTRFGL